MARHLLRVDAVNMDSFVYDTEDISTIRGGSFCLLEAVDGLDQAFPVLERVAEAASQGLYTFEDQGMDSTSSLRKNVLNFLDRETGGFATFAAAITPFANDADFQRALARVEADIHRQQMRRPTVRVPISTRANDPAPRRECFLDGWRPGTVSAGGRALEGNRISSSVAFRRRKGQALRHSLFEKILGEEYTGLRCTPSLGDLASDPSQGGMDGRMALIYVDGNAFGRTRRHTCRSATDRQGFDDAIQNARRAFLKSLVDEARGDPAFRQNGDLRIELLMWGGDEFMVIVPAWRGLQTIQLLYHSLSGMAFAGVPLSHRGALIFCHHQAPIVPLRELAEDMLTRAKSDLVDRSVGLDPVAHQSISPLSDHARGDGFHFLSLESFDMLGGHLDEFVARHYRGLGGDPLPYHHLLMMASDLDDHLQHLATIRRNLPHSAVVDVIQEMLRHRDPATKSPHDQAQTAIDSVVSRALAVLPQAARKPTRDALDAFTKDKPHRWFILNDLWDYVESGGVA